MKARVYNDNPHTAWVEKFKGETVMIPKGGFVDMEFYEAHEFKGQFSPIKILPDETQDPKSFKMIRVEKLTGNEEEAPNAFNCNLCKSNFADEAELIKHSKTHADRVVVDDVAEQSIPKKRGRPAKTEGATT